MTRVKICGITTLEDALHAVDSGADALGFVFAESPRKMTPERVRRITRRLPPFVRAVGVFRNMVHEEVAAIADEAGLDLLQLHGEEPPEYCDRFGRSVLKRFNVNADDTAEQLQQRVAGYRVSACLLDPGGGSGESFPWELALALPGPVIVAGGLSPENVATATRTARPYAVDVCSGVEEAPGRKDPDKVAAFIAAVRRENARNGS